MTHKNRPRLSRLRSEDYQLTCDNPTGADLCFYCGRDFSGGQIRHFTGCVYVLANNWINSHA